jgi:hypothetical protein
MDLPEPYVVSSVLVVMYRLMSVFGYNIQRFPEHGWERSGVVVALKCEGDRFIYCGALSDFCVFTFY